MSTPGYIAIDKLNGTVLDIEGKPGEGFTVEFVKDLSVIGVADFPSDTLHITRDGEVVKTFAFPGKCRLVEIDGEVHHLSAGVSQGVL